MEMITNGNQWMQVYEDDLTSLRAKYTFIQLRTMRSISFKALRGLETY